MHLAIGRMMFIGCIERFSMRTSLLFDWFSRFVKPTDIEMDLLSMEKQIPFNYTLTDDILSILSITLSTRSMKRWQRCHLSRSIVLNFNLHTFESIIVSLTNLRCSTSLDVGRRVILAEFILKEKSLNFFIQTRNSM